MSHRLVEGESREPGSESQKRGEGDDNTRTSDSQHANLWAFLIISSRQSLISLVAAGQKTNGLGPLGVSAVDYRSIVFPIILGCCIARVARVEFIISHVLTRFPAPQGRGVSGWSPGSPLSPSLSFCVSLDLRCRGGSKRATGVRELWPTCLRGNQENGDEANQMLSGHKVYVNEGIC